MVGGAGFGAAAELVGEEGEVLGGVCGVEAVGAEEGGGGEEGEMGGQVIMGRMEGGWRVVRLDVERGGWR